MSFVKVLKYIKDFFLSTQPTECPSLATQHTMVSLISLLDCVVGGSFVSLLQILREMLLCTVTPQEKATFKM
jgi:hypothetical protein